MAWTKQQLIDEALAELALQGFVFDLTPQERVTGLNRLNSMMATWEQRGIRLGFNFAGELPDGSGLPEGAVEPVVANLAIRLAAGYGKTPPTETKRQAREGFGLLLRDAAMPQQQQLPETLPRGSGNRLWTQIGRPYFPPPVDSPIGVTEGGDLFIETE